MCLYYLLHCIASQNIIITTILILLLHISEKLCYYYYYYYFTYILHDYYLISHIYLIDSQLVSQPLIGLLLYGTMLLYILTTSIILNIKLTYQLCTLLALFRMLHAGLLLLLYFQLALFFSFYIDRLTLENMFNLLLAAIAMMCQLLLHNVANPEILFNGLFIIYLYNTSVWLIVEIAQSFCSKFQGSREPSQPKELWAKIT